MPVNHAMQWVVLESFAFGALIVSSRWTVVAMNAAARRVLDQGRHLRLAATLPVR